MKQMLDETTIELTRVTSGIDGLDAILGGGFMLGGIYIVQGHPGAGKTILSNQICFHHVAQGGIAAFVTLMAENHARMLANLRGLAFFDQSVIPDKLVYLSAFAEMRDGGMQALLRLLRQEIQHRKISLLVIDGMVSVQSSSGSEQGFKEFIHDLQEIALGTDCTMFLTTNDGQQASPERTMVDGLIVLSERMFGWQAASDLQVTKFRGSGFLKGRHSYQIGHAGLAVYPRIEALYTHADSTVAASGLRVATGIDRLDIILSGGLLAGSMTMLTGPSGIGKTTMGLQFLTRSSHEQPGLMFSFYETPAQIRLRANRLNPSFDALLQTGVIELHWQTPTSDLLDAYGQRLLDAVRARGVKRLFIDGLTAFSNGAHDPSRVGNFFAALANELRRLGVTTVYTLEIPDVLLPTLRMPLEDASSLAENIIQLRFVAKGSRSYRMLSILKVRDSAFDGSMHEFTLDERGIHLGTSAEKVEWILTPQVQSMPAPAQPIDGEETGRKDG